MLMKKKIIRCLIFLAAIILAVCGTSFIRTLILSKPAPLKTEMLDELSLDNTTKLMIVAHPDDEVIWGGGHLLEGGYLVVCLTNGNNETRSEEFKKVVLTTGNTPLILSYPDKINLKRSDWKFAKAGIKADISCIINYKKWDIIVTHNEAGEYGHAHHKMTHSLVVDAYESLKCDSSLYFFGDYYKAKNIEEASKNLTSLPEEIITKKEELCGMYSSQESVMKKLCHMFPYENWKGYNNNEKTS